MGRQKKFVYMLSMAPMACWQLLLFKSMLMGENISSAYADAISSYDYMPSNIISTGALAFTALSYSITLLLLLYFPNILNKSFKSNF